MSAGWPVRLAGGALQWSRSRSAIPSVPCRLGGLSLPSPPCRVAQAPGCQVVSFPTKEVPLKVSFGFLFFLGFLLFFFFFLQDPQEPVFNLALGESLKRPACPANPGRVCSIL